MVQGGSAAATRPLAHAAASLIANNFAAATATARGALHAASAFDAATAGRGLDALGSSLRRSARARRLFRARRRRAPGRWRRRPRREIVRESSISAVARAACSGRRATTPRASRWPKRSTGFSTRPASTGSRRNGLAPCAAGSPSIRRLQDPGRREGRRGDCCADGRERGRALAGVFGHKPLLAAAEDRSGRPHRDPRHQRVPAQARPAQCRHPRARKRADCAAPDLLDATHGSGRRAADACASRAEQVTIPSDVGCCAFAGDKGFSRPEMNAHALRALAPAVGDCASGYSTSRTCEIGLTAHGGIPYRSIARLVDRVAQKPIAPRANPLSRTETTTA